MAQEGSQVRFRDSEIVWQIELSLMWVAWRLTHVSVVNVDGKVVNTNHYIQMCGIKLSTNLSL